MYRVNAENSHVFDAFGTYLTDHVLLETYNKLVLRCTKSDPHFGGMRDAELLAPLGVGRRGKERRIVAGLLFPFAVEIVRHQVDEIQITTGRSNHKDFAA